MQTFIIPPLPPTCRPQLRLKPRYLRPRCLKLLRCPPTCRRADWRDIINTVPAVEVRKNSLVVPRHLWDSRMRRAGVYRSVEYVVERLVFEDREIHTTLQVAAQHRRHVIAFLRPLNPLLPRFERSWPVQVPLGDAVLWSYKRDLLQCAAVTIALSASFLTTGFVGPNVLGVYSIPSCSMEPSLHVGDALLVEKVSLKATPPRKGEIVLFRPPNRLMRMLTDTQSKPLFHRNSLFVKRVAATPGDIIEISSGSVVVNGVKVDKAAPYSPYVAPQRIPDGYVFVIGDNPDKSLDSRYWGLLPVDFVVGRPIARIFPLDRIDKDV